ncbi:peptidylprolyl isomerase [Phormidium yuhuli AB48]|uniref:Peptidyl-prolyl cis-trans isomerase n=1 Tax=Phormidium yuhuli AB48 TaxID=2940671 RepID=A0ABY5AQF1_9CYAN|nr:peptidylprolyl isomerase [Phormidium yuhuli]USR91457.1 peptidylprolyl isomerase [Phormidium yuhuli AB48]
MQPLTQSQDRWWRLRLTVLLVISLTVLASCTQVTDLAETSSTTTATVQDVAATTPRLEGMATVVMVVNGGSITIEVNGEDAPVTAGNFVDLVQKGVYDGTSFHRVVREPEPFVVQGGDPLSADADVPVSRLGTGNYVNAETGQPRYIPLEIKPQGASEPLYGETLMAAGVREAPLLNHRRGAVAMARSQSPNSASAQFYFALDDLSFLDGNYAVFGYVSEGMEVVDGIQQGDRIQSATVTEGAEFLVQ